MPTWWQVCDGLRGGIAATRASGRRPSRPHPTRRRSRALVRGPDRCIQPPRAPLADKTSASSFERAPSRSSSSSSSASDRSSARPPRPSSACRSPTRRGRIPGPTDTPERLSPPAPPPAAAPISTRLSGRPRARRRRRRRRSTRRRRCSPRTSRRSAPPPARRGRTVAHCPRPRARCAERSSSTSRTSRRSTRRCQLGADSEEKRALDKIINIDETEKANEWRALPALLVAVSSDSQRCCRRRALGRRVRRPPPSGALLAARARGASPLLWPVLVAWAAPASRRSTSIGTPPRTPAARRWRSSVATGSGQPQHRDRRRERSLRRRPSHPPAR